MDGQDKSVDAREGVLLEWVYACISYLGFDRSCLRFVVKEIGI